MRISSRGLDTGFVYPCTRREVIDAFGKDLLSSASFDAKFQWWKRDHGCKERPFKGHVLASLYVTDWQGYFDRGAEVSLDIYRIAEKNYSEHIGHALVRILKQQMRPWAEEKLKEIENGNYRNYKLIAGFNSDGLFLYEVRHLSNSSEIRSLPIH